MEIKVGCCGTAGLSLKNYSKIFPIVELQSTFYRLPKEKTALSWREEVEKDFCFTLKAFQAITHPSDSPTWRRVKKPKGDGYLKPTEENFKEWDKTLKIVEILKGEYLVVQLPPSFKFNEENLKNLKNFFSSCKRICKIGIEFRDNSWFKDELSSILEDLNLVHIVDPLVNKPLTSLEDYYFRLHGLGKRLYHYKYSEEDLKRLLEYLKNLKASRVYVFFNNLNMREDAIKLISLLKKEV
ncbi:hypothetical protein HRbin06_00277 [archaeon HR06]|nr:hypothetical protein HRbin06_00277 [archaeon HR06]